MIQGIRTYQTPAVTLGMRQKVSTGRQEPLSKDFIRSVVLVIGITCFVVAGLSQAVHWGFSGNMERLTSLQGVHKIVANENISLLAARGGLMSKKHIKDVAAARLQLSEARDSQIHRL
jgi:hypothetical protein